MISSDFMLSVVSVIVLLGVLIFVHEMGHFLMAKYFNVGVLKFSLGFGRKLIGKRIGETEYVLSLIPLGGYVKLLGESEGEGLSPEDERRSFIRQSVWKRMAIVFSGPLFNFFLAIVIFAAVYMIGVPVLTNQIGTVLKDGAAFEAGLQANDIVLKVDGVDVNRWDKMAEKINKSGGKNLNFTIQRGTEIKEIGITPRMTKAKNIFGEEKPSYKIGVGPSPKTVVERLNPVAALSESLKQTWFITEMTFMSIVKIFEGVISPKNLGGPILIAQMAGEQVKGGIVPFVFFMALLSINLGVLNLLPIPVLDGGHLFFYIIEAIRGKDISVKWKERAQQVGFILLIILMIFVVIMDIDRLSK
ncbi:MAG: RIP metalloprotease RseP [Syntrophales bacterium]|nr:RIP metalloprotease RseP [Syntrophales bacterium]